MWRMTLTQMKIETISEKKFELEQTIEIESDNLASLSVLGEQLLSTSKKPLSVKFERVDSDGDNN